MNYFWGPHEKIVLAYIKRLFPDKNSYLEAKRVIQQEVAKFKYGKHPKEAQAEVDSVVQDLTEILNAGRVEKWEDNN